MSEKDKSLLFGYDKLQDLYINSTAERVKEISDEELKRLKVIAKNMYLFFESMQLTTKKLCNSIYGGLGTPVLRYFNPNIANDITSEGRNVCQLMERVGQNYFTKVWQNDFAWHKHLAEKFPEFIQEDTKIIPITQDIVITADTDSNYVTFDFVFESLGLNPKKIDIKRATEFVVYFMQNKVDPIYAEILEKYITSRNGENHMIFELEAVSGFGIFVAKKKYVYAKLWQDGKYVADKGQLKVTGLEIKQNASSKTVKDIIETFINTIFVEKGEISANTFFGMCASVKTKLKSYGVNDLAKATKLRNNKYDEYVIDDVKAVVLKKKCPFAVKASARYNKFVRDNNLTDEYPILKNDMFIKVYYDKNGEPFAYPSEYGCPPTAPPFSLEIQLEKMIFNPIKRLVDGLIDGNLKEMGRDKIQVGLKSLMTKKYK